MSIPDTHGQPVHGWIGVDLDGTLAEYDGWKGPEHIGRPIPAMVARIKRWLAEGHEVRIFTARVSGMAEDALPIRSLIMNWCEAAGLPRLPVTNVKDYSMWELWDDRAVRVVANTGYSVEETMMLGLKRMASKLT